MSDEKDFDLVNKYIIRIRKSKEDFEIIFSNGSKIKFIAGNDSSRGQRYHYAIVDKEISNEIFENVIRCKGILFDIAKKENKLNDNYNIEFIDM